ncbi:MAG TPA: hypothetical protein VM925_31520, partial [Labilithrix sp.]|nr:hypothetical protein [Labilithrix sp.]
MKLVTYERGNETRSGLLVGEASNTVLDLARALAHLGSKVDGRTVLGLVEAGAEGLEAGRAV